MDAHYFFPPASAYPINKALFLLKSDDAFRARYQSDPDAALGELGLDATTRGQLRAFDRDALVARGAHPYLVFMAQLRLRMEREPGTMELF